MNDHFLRFWALATDDHFSRLDSRLRIEQNLILPFNFIIFFLQILKKLFVNLDFFSLEKVGQIFCGGLVQFLDFGEAVVFCCDHGNLAMMSNQNISALILETDGVNGFWEFYFSDEVFFTVPNLGISVNRT